MLVLVLATGSKWAGPLSFPDGKSDHEVFVRQWTDKFRDAKDVTLIGAGAVGIGEFLVIKQKPHRSQQSVQNSPASSGTSTPRRRSRSSTVNLW